MFLPDFGFHEFNCFWIYGFDMFRFCCFGRFLGFRFFRFPFFFGLSGFCSGPLGCDLLLFLFFSLFSGF